ncbi:hypothetical protein [Arthrobacter sp. NPDC058192]|uniref:hypothetical protein n=1 Tax=Arthrobacter sp. NPDC058192 TaxID=3346372 RepID=UPI0036E4B406
MDNSTTCLGWDFSLFPVGLGESKAMTVRVTADKTGYITTVKTSTAAAAMVK